MATSVNLIPNPPHPLLSQASQSSKVCLTLASQPLAVRVHTDSNMVPSQVGSQGWMKTPRWVSLH